MAAAGGEEALALDKKHVAQVKPHSPQRPLTEVIEPTLRRRRTRFR